MHVSGGQLHTPAAAARRDSLVAGDPSPSHLKADSQSSSVPYLKLLD